MHSKHTASKSKSHPIDHDSEPSTPKNLKQVKKSLITNLISNKENFPEPSLIKVTLSNHIVPLNSPPHIATFQTEDPITTPLITPKASVKKTILKGGKNSLGFADILDCKFTPENVLFREKEVKAVSQFFAE